MYNIAVIPGDGIGPEVVEAAITILDKLPIDFNYTYANAEINVKKIQVWLFLMKH